jgi:hypothetical protein
MQTTAQDSTNYAANPELLANMSDEQIDALANAPGTPDKTTEGDTAGEQPASATPGAEKVEVKEPAADGTPASAEEPEKVVQTKDGQHVIPYSVLERERDRALRAESTAAALAEEVKQLQAGKVPPESAAVTLTEEDLAQLDEDLPDFAKAIRAQMSMIEALAGTVKTLQKGQEVTERSAEQVRVDAEEAAIAANPTLVALRGAMQANDPKAQARWNRVVDAYSALCDDPEFVGADTAELINRAAAGTAAIYGDILAGITTKPVAPAASPATPEALKAKADAALAAADKSGVSAPRSLGDIPGGSAPAVDEAAAILSKGPQELQAYFDSMTPDQIEAKLNRLR